MSADAPLENAPEAPTAGAPTAGAATDPAAASLPATGREADRTLDAPAVRRKVEKFDCCDHSELKDLLQEVCEVVSQGHGRIEITACDARHRCVIISKEELEHLESALAILSGTGVARSAHASVARLCTTVEQRDGSVAEAVSVLMRRKFTDA